ncbi:hypothetical protein Tco_1105225 [Tanacetum coccineum]
MTSFDCRLKAIKACSACGNLHTSAFCCSKEKLKNKILVPMPESSQQHIKIERICFDCGDLLHGLNCLECDLTRKILEKAFQKFQNTSKSSNDNSNVVNAPREPFVVKQDPSVNSSQKSPLIDQKCCCECGDSLDGIFCQPLGCPKVVPRKVCDVPCHDNSPPLDFQKIIEDFSDSNVDSTFDGRGYQQKDRKPSQNDKTEHGMEKTVQNQGQSPKMPKSESILKNTIECNLNPSDGPGKPNSIFMKTVKTKWALNQFTTAHLCAIDKDCEDFEGPILAQLQPISAIVHTKPTS